MEGSKDQIWTVIFLYFLRERILSYENSIYFPHVSSVVLLAIQNLWFFQIQLCSLSLDCYTRPIGGMV